MMEIDLKEFVFDRILDQNTLTHTLAVLGTLPSPSTRLPAILRFELTPLPSDLPSQLSSGIIASTKQTGTNDIYSWFSAWLHKRDDIPDCKIYVICPATDTHIRKYSKQNILMVHETPALYHSIVKPYIQAFDPSRIQWVHDILAGTAEASKIINTSPDFLILPDMKWDITDVSALYLLALYTHHDLSCIRDLRKTPHLPMLKALRRDASRVVHDNWGISPGGVRMYIHYQPSYYHFHVHVVHTGHLGLGGMAVGQAHLLDDIISLLELDPDHGPSVLERMTFTYGLGTEHGLYKPMTAALAELHGDAD